MTTKRQDDPFTTTALVPASRQVPTTLAPSQRTRSLDRAERWISGEAHKQELVIREQARKTEVGQGAIGGLYESGYREAQATAEHIWEMRRPNGRDLELQHELDHAAVQFIRSATGGIYAVTVDSAERIREEIDRSLYRETLERTGLLAKLRGDA